MRSYDIFYVYFFCKEYDKRIAKAPTVISAAFLKIILTRLVFYSIKVLSFKERIIERLFKDCAYTPNTPKQQMFKNASNNSQFLTHNEK